MNDSSFIFFTQDEIISKMNIDPRIQESFKNVFIRIQEYLNKKGYTNGKSYLDFLSKKMIDLDEPFSIKIDDTNILVSEFEGKFDYTQNTLLINAANLNSPNLEHILCHEIIHFLSHHLSNDYVNSISQNVVDGKMSLPFTTSDLFVQLDHKFTEEALTEIITSEIMQQNTMAYDSQIQIQRFFNELSGEDVIKNFFQGYVYSDYNKIKAYVANINAYEQKFLNDNVDSVFIENNIELVQAQRELIKTFLNPQNSKSIEEYISSYEKLLKRPIKDEEYVSSIISQMDKIFLENTINLDVSIKKEKLEQVKKLLEKKHYFGDKNLFEFQFGNRTLGVSSEGIIYGDLTNIGIDNSISNKVVLWQNGQNITIELDKLQVNYCQEKIDAELKRAISDFNKNKENSGYPKISSKVRQIVYKRDVLTPHIKDTLRTDGEMAMEEEFGKEMSNTQQSSFNKPHISTETKRKVEKRDLRLQDVSKSNATNQCQMSDKTEKAKLEEQRRDLRRMQFGEKSKSTIVNTQKVPNLNDVLRQQQIIQQQQQMNMDDELEQHNGMSM